MPKNRLKYFIFLFLSCCLISHQGYTQKKTISSPDSRFKFILSYKDSLTYRVTYKGHEIIQNSPIALELSDRVLGITPRLKHSQIRQVNQQITPLYGKNKTLSERYHELRLDFEGDYALIIRAYDEGVAYRFVTDIDSEVIVKNEKAIFRIDEQSGVVFPEALSLSVWEVSYIDYASSSGIADQKRAITPVLFTHPAGIRTVIAESDVRDYPGMYLTKNKGHFQGTFAAYPDSVAMGSWCNFVAVVQTRQKYIARTSGKREFPWRIIMATDDDKTLLNNELVYKLATPQRITDTDWIKPGKAAWEWWHDAMLPGSDLPSGMNNRNTALYKHYIDFAAENQLEYLMLDAGWSDLFDLTKVNPQIDIQELVSYGKSKNVGVFLWCVAHTLISDIDKYMKTLSDWGIAGLKVDFFDRDDQIAMGWYEEIARKAADYRLMVNLHGCSKPTGLQRAYPNIVNYEAVRGAECSKWDLTANPRHHLTFPFIRMLGGSLDYTPGSMRNRSRQMFKPVDPGLPFSQGSRCHELAMFVIFDQYFAMLCDSPAEYRKYPDILRFLSAVPTTFDETRVLQAKVGEYALMAKRKGNDWYVGGMTDWTAREMEIDFSFLTPGKKYKAEIYKDGYDANIYADQYVFVNQEIDNNSKLNIKLASGGGVAIRIVPLE